jgi:uncharacterized metal-binding protein YceD (DUF177 family)
VKGLREYSIPFSGLKAGIHHFNYELDETFFSHFENSLVSESRIFADLAFEKKERLFILNFDISGSMKTECDRCGLEFNMPLHGNHTLYVKLGDMRKEDENNEEVLWLPENEVAINIAEHLYEFIHLSIPMHKTHPDKPDGISGCDPEITKHIGEHHDENTTDPRWEILKKLDNLN